MPVCPLSGHPIPQDLMSPVPRGSRGQDSPSERKCEEQPLETGLAQPSRKQSREQVRGGGVPGASLIIKILMEG
jgi:hypothetical protein